MTRSIQQKRNSESGGDAYRALQRGAVWVWRELGAHAALLGLALTLLVAVLDWTGALRPIERIFYNARARNCQFFTPPPPDHLVHLDIDDTALETIGRWPWPRSTLAEIIDELRLAGASELSLDILLADPQEPGIVRNSDGSIDVIDHDANLVAALKRFGKVVVPVNFSFEEDVTHTSGYPAVVNALHDDLELNLQEIPARLHSSSPPPDENEFLFARRDAMRGRLDEALSRPGAHPIEEVRHQLLPNPDRAAAGSSIQREFDREYQKALCNHELQRFSLPAPGVSDDTPMFLEYDDSITMTLPFAQVATYSGYVNYLKKTLDPTIDSVPLCVSYRGRIYPQMDLSLACAAMGVDPQKITLQADQIILPEPGGKQTIIPVHEFRSVTRGIVGMFMDIPWAGTGEWETMYDYPAYKQPKRHMIITLPWAVAETRKRITENNIVADNALGYFSKLGVDSATNFLKNPPSADQMDARLKTMQAILNEATGLAGPTLNTPPADLKPDEKDFINALNDLKNALAANQANWVQLQQRAAELHSALNGKAVLIGVTSTALGDEDPTPLHSACPGVVIHGVIFNSIYGGNFWRTAPRWINLLIILFVGVLTTRIVARHHALKALLLTTLIGVPYLLINCLLLFDYGKWIVGLAGPMIVIALVWGAMTLVRLIAEAQERARITRRFQSYVDPAVVQYVLDHPELKRLEGEVREMTVCFTDLAGFTTFTEKLREKAVKVLGRYIVKMVPPIRNNAGLIHRFMGDGIFFSYGAPIPNPNMAIGAVATVLEMHEELAKLNEELEAEGIPKLKMRAGVNTGMAVVGDSGADDAIEYACLGDTTNLAARLEGANTFTGTRILIAARTAELLDGQFLLRPIARLVVKGKSEGVMTYEPLARTESATEMQKHFAALTAQLFDHFIAARFTECIVAAETLDKEFGPSVLTTLYRDLCGRYLADPLKDFQGDVVLSEK